MRAPRGKSSRISISMSKIAPNLAPPGTAFHHDTMAANEKQQPRIAMNFHQGWCSSKPTPAETRQRVEASQTRLKT